MIEITAELITMALLVVYLYQTAIKYFWLTLARRRVAIAIRTCELVNNDRIRTRAGAYKVRY